MLGERRRPLDPSPQIYSHSRTRTTSSNVFPVQQPTPMHLQQPSMGHSRRSPSVNTFSTVSSNTPPAAFRTSPTTELRRSTSSRSGGQATSYVALLRKQKATVWCDRAQYEDPRIAAQQRAAKQRAHMEVLGGTAPGRTSTGISSAGKVAAKIRHHGKPGVVGYAPENNYVGVGGVPMRLSATEVEGEDSDDDDVAAQRLHHRRTGSSGRSSTASGRRVVSYRSSGGVGPGKRWSPGDTPERAGSLVEDKAEYEIGDERNFGRAQSTRSGSSGERADALPEMGGPSAAKLASNSLLNAALTREKSVKNPEDLRRRGSVDERTMTLTAGRLYIANPD
ncbi:uncharacterized protein BCR38DRAFT_454417 [Pseudomassariella vexata]|uniref:Uncharacterized protein n=1 Tax=Pseudomassariella vexata TaxID=1141098 RepID=A0A1Y2ELB0_9PEZI|nr:uncharacterized protein BCR38DRAFT_454417 [Pseudomassariella vexata]ORY72066.1 hypothetical protein BCR38DRAFT_454417 [Pseudomassariella vexata]